MARKSMGRTRSKKLSAPDAIERCDVLHAEIYRKQLQKEQLESEIADLVKERNQMLRLLEGSYGIQFREPDIKELRKAMDAQAQRPRDYPSMIRILLRERFDEGMTSQEIVDDIKARWGRFHEIKENSIRIALSRMKKGGKRIPPDEVYNDEGRWFITFKPNPIVKKKK